MPSRDGTDGVQSLELVNVSKRFPGVQALSDLSLGLTAGEVVGLVGENGAGKSTLIKILSGVFPPTSGHVAVNGQKLAIDTPHKAERAGIRTIYQELNLCPHLSVADNIALGSEPRVAGVLRPFFINQRAVKDSARGLLDELGVKLPIDEPVLRLTAAQRQIVEIAKALSRDASVLILDEPTSSLSGHEVERLLTLVCRLKERGKLIIFVSHRIDEVLRVADRVVVLRDGKLVGELPGSDATHDKVVQLMVGRDLDFVRGHRQLAPSARSLLDVESLIVAQGKPPLSFSLNQGEILCLAGLVGSGRSEILHAIFQSRPARAGRIALGGQLIRRGHPRRAIGQGLGFVPEDRKLQGIILSMSLSANLTLPALDRLTRFGLISRRRERRLSEELIGRYMIRASNPEVLARNLSGGNQQKAVLAKWLSLKPKILLVDEPTRGVDVGGKAEIYDLLRKMAAAGVGILMVSSEIEEVLRIATRVLVVAEGQISNELAGAQITEENILKAAVAPV